MAYLNINISLVLDNILSLLILDVFLLQKCFINFDKNYKYINDIYYNLSLSYYSRRYLHQQFYISF